MVCGRKYNLKVLIPGREIPSDFDTRYRIKWAISPKMKAGWCLPWELLETVASTGRWRNTGESKGTRQSVMAEGAGDLK